MASSVSYTFNDFSNEKSHTRITIEPITSGNMAATLTALTALQNAILAITLGALKTSAIVLSSTDVDGSTPSDVNAQRERKWLVVYRDTVTQQLYRIEIPTAALTGNLVAGSDLADLAATDIAAFVSAFEAIAQSPDLNPVTVSYIKHVGARL